MSSQEDNENWILGVILGLLGSIAINTGNNIQSLGLKGVQSKSKDNESHRRVKTSSYRCCRRRKTAPLTSNKNEETEDAKENVQELLQNQQDNHPCTSITWVVGTVIFVSGSLLNFASYAFAAQSMLASLESIQFVTNLIFGKFMLKANVTKNMLIGTGLTVMGTILAVQFSSRATLNLRTEDIKVLYSNPAYLIYLVLMIGMLFLLNFVYHYYEKRKVMGKPIRYSSIVIPLSYSIWSALFGTQSVVQAKVLAELLAVHSSEEENIFESWFTYTTIIAWIMTVGVWLSRLNNALSKFDPLLIIPLLQCSFIFFAIVSGGIFFKEFNEFNATQWVGFWGGVLVMFSGLVLLTPTSTRKIDDERLSKEVATLLRTKAMAVSDQEHENNTDSIYLIEQQLIQLTNSKKSPTKHSLRIIPRDATLGERQKTPLSQERSPRHSMTQSAVTQLNAVKDAVIESANMFLTPPTGTNAITDAMVDATKRKEERIQRKEKLKQLQDLLKRDSAIHKEKILSREVLELVYDLGLEDQVSRCGIPSVAKEFDKLRIELGSPREFRESILKKASDLEKSLYHDDCEMQETPHLI